MDVNHSMNHPAKMSLETFQYSGGGYAQSHGEESDPLPPNQITTEGMRHYAVSHPQHHPYQAQPSVPHQHQFHQHQHLRGGPFGSSASASSSSSKLSHYSLVDEAYRRVGQKLSLQAHGESSPSHGVTVRRIPITPSRNSSFDVFQRRPICMDSVDLLTRRSTSSSAEESSQHQQQLNHHQHPHDRSSSPPTPHQQDQHRSTKVAKIRYSDHGEHHPKVTAATNLLRRLTFEGRENFLQWEQTHRRQQAANVRSSTGDSEISPHRQALSRLALDTWGDVIPPQTKPNYTEGYTLNQGGNTTTNSQTKGLLSAVLEGHSESNTTHSHPPSPAPSISTKESKAMSSVGFESQGVLGNNFLSTSSSVVERGRCLTTPSAPVANDGWDNEEGNLIVHENYRFLIPPKSIHTIAEDERPSLEGPMEYQVIGLLGQGTFAQVFKCLHVQSGNTVAIKVVKNKPAYTRQATVEIDVFRVLKEGNKSSSVSGSMVDLICFFMHHSHLCLVFELLGQNLYEILKRRQFRGLPLTIVRDIVGQMTMSIWELSQKSIVHCDLKPENVLLVSDIVADDLVAAREGRRRAPSVDVTSSNTDMSHISVSLSTLKTVSSSNSSFKGQAATPSAKRVEVENNNLKRRIKIIDFGSACFEGYSAHTYIQSRFYRSPEVLLGLPYDSVIDTWSLGCVAAELFLGLPILPGIHEHDQIGRITEMISPLPYWMIDQGTKSSKYYVKSFNRVTPDSVDVGVSGASPMHQWRLKSQEEYIASLSQSEIRKKGGISRLEQQPGNRYFKRTRLADILFLHGLTTVGDDKELLPSFVHFLYGLLEPDPWKRWTTFQALQHPFLTGDLEKLRIKPPAVKQRGNDENQANIVLSLYWEAPWDPAICRRKLLSVQQLREKQQTPKKNSTGCLPLQNVPTPESIDGEKSSRTHETNLKGTGIMLPVAVEDVDFLRRKQNSPPTELSLPAGLSFAPNISAATVANRQAECNIVSSSLSSIGHQGRIGQPAYRSPARFDQRMTPQLPLALLSGPQSYTGHTSAPSCAITEDFALALQRPGVVPGSGQDSSVSTHNTWNTTQNTHPETGMYVQHGSANNCGYPGVSSFTQQSTNEGQIAESAFAGQAMYQQQFMPVPVANPYGVHGTGSTLLCSPSNQFGHGYISHPMSSGTSVASSVTMSEAATIDIQQQALHYHHQVSALQQQQNNPAGLQSGYAMPQQVYLATAPGSSGAYFVTTSTSGQPILLQSLAFVDPTQANRFDVPAPNQQVRIIHGHDLHQTGFQVNQSYGHQGAATRHNQLYHTTSRRQDQRKDYGGTSM